MGVGPVLERPHSVLLGHNSILVDPVALSGIKAITRERFERGNTFASTSGLKAILYPTVFLLTLLVKTHFACHGLKLNSLSLTPIRS